MDNTVNDLLYENKFENRVKDKSNFFIKRNIVFLFFLKKSILFLETYLFNVPENLTVSAFFAEAILKTIDMPRKKPWHYRMPMQILNAALNAKNDQMINSELFFC